jgi:hypothetical protein
MLAPLLAAVLLAAEPPAVPDPYGLGERLALMDHLREAYRLTPAPGTSVEDLRTLYAEAWRRTQPADDEAAVRRRDDAARLRRRIADRHHHEVAASLSLEDLQALWKQLEAQREATDAATIAARLREDPGPSRSPKPEPAATAPTTASVTPPAEPPEVPAARGRMTVHEVGFPAEGVKHCRLFQGRNTLLGIQFGAERGREFQGVFEYMADQLQRSRGPRSAIVLLGHGSGASIAGESIDGHLRRWKTFYETFGGTRPAAPVECLVIASCSRRYRECGFFHGSAPGGDLVCFSHRAGGQGPLPGQKFGPQPGGKPVTSLPAGNNHGFLSGPAADADLFRNGRFP